MTSIDNSKETELIYGNLLETIDVGFYQVTLDGQMLNHNRAHNIILGYNPSERLESIDVRIFWQNPEDRKIYVDHLLREGFTKNFVCHALKKNGEKIIVELNSHLIRDENGRPFRIDGTFIDVTDKFNLEKKLKESEEKYRLISETAYDLIGILDKNFRYEYINETAFQQILGYSSMDLLGKSVLDFTHPNDISTTAKALKEGFKNGEGGAELRFRHKEGHWIWIEAKGKTFFDKEGDFKAIVISRNITERKIAERRLKESEKKYREAYNRANFYKDLFAHDINNILQIISSSSELISYHLGDSEKSKVIDEISKIIKKQVERGAKLVSSVHTLSRLEEEEINAQPTEICKLMEKAIDFVKKSHNDRTIDINIDCVDQHICVNANELLQDVFENILLNSVKHNENSEVEIKITVSKKQVNAKYYNKIEFSDNGIGVQDERKKIIFKRDTGEIRGSKGMGLGLSLVKKIITSFNGKVWVEDRLKGDYSKGSNFIIVLPELE
ncbi:MAG: PAS domain-containing sensor histidine kinase [Promethearchaeota archaeon]|nr:MAG: PAS domain-containing sensor histidine kinase [Candidatus Lokiarchaeota archaeon]